MYYDPPWNPHHYWPGKPYVYPRPSVCPGCGRCNHCGHTKTPPKPYYPHHGYSWTLNGAAPVATLNKTTVES